jgi:hypothetical protein
VPVWARVGERVDGPEDRELIVAKELIEVTGSIKLTAGGVGQSTPGRAIRPHLYVDPPFANAA